MLYMVDSSRVLIGSSETDAVLGRDKIYATV